MGCSPRTGGRSCRPSTLQRAYFNSNPCGPLEAPERETCRGLPESTPAAANALAISGRCASILTAEALRDLSEGRCGVKANFANWGDYLFAR